MEKKPILNSNDHASKIVDILGLKPHIPRQAMIALDLTREKSARRSIADILGKKKERTKERKQGLHVLGVLQQIISLASYSVQSVVKAAFF